MFNFSFFVVKKTVFVSCKKVFIRKPNEDFLHLLVIVEGWHWRIIPDGFDWNKSTPPPHTHAQCGSPTSIPHYSGKSSDNLLICWNLQTFPHGSISPRGACGPQSCACVLGGRTGGFSGGQIHARHGRGTKGAKCSPASKSRWRHLFSPAIMNDWRRGTMSFNSRNKSRLVPGCHGSERSSAGRGASSAGRASDTPRDAPPQRMRHFCTDAARTRLRATQSTPRSVTGGGAFAGHSIGEQNTPAAKKRRARTREILLNLFKSRREEGPQRPRTPTRKYLLCCSHHPQSFRPQRSGETGTRGTSARSRRRCSAKTDPRKLINNQKYEI